MSLSSNSKIDIDIGVDSQEMVLSPPYLTSEKSKVKFDSCGKFYNTRLPPLRHRNVDLNYKREDR